MSAPQNDLDIARLHAVAGDLRVVMGTLKRRLREETHIGDLTWSQVLVLTRIDREGPATVSTLARAEGVRSQSMGETISVLKEFGLVSGTPDPNDGRQTILSLTEACREWIQAARTAREDWLFRTIRTQFTPAEQEQLAAAVELLKRLADS